MTTTIISTLVALDAGVDEDVVRGLLAETPASRSPVPRGLDRGWAALDESAPDAVVVACEPESENVLWFLREAARKHPDRPSWCSATASPNGSSPCLRGRRRRPRDAPGRRRRAAATAEQLGFAVEKAVARRRAARPPGAAALASLICVLGPKGGIGKTLTSANLAVALAPSGKRVVVVDLDLQFGDVGLSLGLTPQRTIYDLVKSGGSLDAEKLEAYLTPHESGARVLMAPVRPDQASAVTVEFLQELYPLLRASHDFVIVDTPPGFMPEVIASIDASTHVCMVGTLDSLSLKNTKLGLETLELMGYEGERIRMVLNRADTQGRRDPRRRRPRSSGARPTCSCPATATSRARSTRASRSCRRGRAPTSPRAFRSLADSTPARAARAKARCKRRRRG